MKIHGFCDLNISIPAHQFQQNHVEQLLSLGYKTVALNITLGEESNENPKKKKSLTKDTIPAPKPFGNNEEVSRNLQILQRVTVRFTDSSQLQKLKSLLDSPSLPGSIRTGISRYRHEIWQCKSDNAKKYDIISVIPKSYSAFQLACACKEIDLISFDASDRPILMNRKLYNLAIANGIYFEVPYAPAIADSGKRKNTIQIAHLYHTYGKSKNVVITGGATNISKIRGPYDVVNLALLFGLSEEQAKHSLLNTSRALILRAEGRRFGRTAMTMTITDVNQESEEDSDDEPVTKRSKGAVGTDSVMLLA